MPWSVAPWRLGRDWPLAPEPETLRRRWRALAEAGVERREVLFEPTRARTTRSSVAALPGRATGAARLARDPGPCPEPVRVLDGPFDTRWLLPDHRLLDAARPELWRAQGPSSRYLLEPGPGGPALLATALLPTGRNPHGRARPVRPLHRGPDADPNLAPGLVPFLAGELGVPVAAEDVFAWIVYAAVAGPGGCEVPLPRRAEEWEAGAAWGADRLRLLAPLDGERPRLPGGRRPYVRAPIVPDGTGEDGPYPVAYDRESGSLRVGGGRIAPVPSGAWEFTCGGARVLADWVARRTAAGAPGTLEEVAPREWPQERTRELLELITVLALLSEAEAVRPQAAGPVVGEAELRAAGVLPVPAAARRPGPVLAVREEGPEGQSALW
ncbi:type ISP restriction/modification enzyme [Streptomyces sp. NPDC058373]|uniref:type ISP restriction/modification enzyme n=1 Tax=Streptomyces sp. NPDC058373 TaxID=3346465 RepID=UPI0036536BD6